MSRSPFESLWVATLWVLGISAASLTLLIAVFLLAESWPALTGIGGRFLSDSTWHPAARAGEGTFGFGPMLLGTLLAALGAIVLAAPLGVAAAVFSRLFAPPPLASIFRRVVELMAGVPSVVYGLWGLGALVPLIQRIEPPGASLLAGALVLAAMILPTVALTADAAFAAVPEAPRQAAAALGLSRWGILRGALWPLALPGIFAGILLAVGRALGETMAVVMVCGNVVAVPDSLFAPVRTLTANIALEMAYALEDHRSALFVSGLALLAIVAALVAAAELVGRRVSHG